jgi:hypothetical protein
MMKRPEPSLELARSYNTLFWIWSKNDANRRRAATRRKMI